MQKIFSIIVVLSFLIAAPGVLAQNSDLPAVSGVELPSPGITPGSPFYFLKTWKESIQTFFTFGAENKAKQFLHLAEVRLAEYQKMVEHKKLEIAEKTLEKYERQFNQALEKAEEAKEKGKDVEELVELITEKTLKHQEVLTEVLEKVPEQAKKGIENAIEMSQKGFEKAVEAVSGEKKEELERKAEEIKIKVETADWKTYINEKYGYSFKYPPECRYGSMLPYCKQDPPEERPPECLCFLVGENPDEVFLQAFTGEKDNLTLADFSVSHYMTQYFNPPFGTDLVSWLKEKFSNLYKDISDKPNAEIDRTPAVKFYTPRSPQAFSGETIYFIKNDKLFVISMLDVDSESNRKLYNHILSTFKFIELEKAEEEAPKIEEVPRVEEKPIAPSTPALEAPVLTDPGISVNKHQPFTLNWTSVKGAKRYWLQRDTSTNFSIPAWYRETNSDTDNPGVGTSAPEVTTTYYYRVKACDDRECGPWSNVVDMKVIVPVPSITVTSPNGGEKFSQGTNITITWDSKGVDYVDIDLLDWGRKQEDGSVPFILDLATNYSASKGTYTWKIYSDWPTGNLYKIRVASLDNLIKDTSDNHFSIASLSPTCPVPEDPIVSAIPTGPVNSGAEYSISWSIVAGASHYILQRDTNLAFSNPSVIYSGSLLHTKKESHSPSVSTVYWYKARAENSCGVGPWSNIVGIQVEVPTAPAVPAVPAAPVLTDPGISVNKHQPFTLNWTSVSGAASYILRRDTNSSFSNPVTVYSGLLNSFSGDLSPSVSTTYYFRVEACNNTGGCSSGSNVVDMQVIVPSITVTSPNGGETLKPGETLRIIWSSVGVDSVRIKLFYLSQAMYDMTKNVPVPAAPGYYDAIIPSIEPGREGDYYKIGIFDASNAAIIDHSNNYFSIVVPSITVISPNGGETWTIGQTKRVSWSSAGINYVRIYVYDESIAGSGSTNYINDDAIPASTGYYDWTIQKNRLPGSTLGFPRNYKIRVDGVNEATLGSTVIVWDWSDSYFSIIEGAVGLENIRNQLASVSEVISRLMENVKKLMADPIGIPSGSYGVKVLAQKAILQTGCGKIECVEKGPNFYDKYGPANWTDAGAECICQYYTSEEWKLRYCGFGIGEGPPTEEELQHWRDCGVPVPGAPPGVPPTGWIEKEEYEIHEPTDLTQVTFLNYYSDPDWSPDGNQIIFERQKEDDRGLYLINVNGAGLTKIGPGHNPSWSPVDNRIIYRGEDPWHSLFLIDLDKGWENKVKLVDQINEHGSWSPDGKKIAYDSPHSSESSSIWVTNSDGSGKTRLTTNEDGYSIGPSFNYDGSKIVYLKGFASYAVGGGEDKSNEIWVMDADGFNKHMIYAPGDSTQLIFQRAWNKNNKILFMRTWYRVRPPQVWMINADGSDPKLVVAGSDVFGDPVWDNTGTKVAISRSPLQPVAPGDIWIFSYEEPAEEIALGTEEEITEGVEGGPRNIFQKIWEAITNFFKWIFRIVE